MNADDDARGEGYESLAKLPPDLLDLPTAERMALVQRWLRTRSPQAIRHVVFVVMYDITDDKVRKYVADFLLREGMVRIQKSVFLGKRPVKAYRTLADKLREINGMYANHDSILVMPVPEEKAYRMRVIGVDLDVRMVLARPNVLVI